MKVFRAVRAFMANRFCAAAVSLGGGVALGFCPGQSCGEPLGEPAPPAAATGAARNATATADVVGPNDPRASALKEYLSKKVSIPDTAAANKELALWCDQHGLWDAAKTRWEAVRQLDPTSDQAQKRLGFRRRNHAWVYDGARAENMARGRANAFWGKELKRLHLRMKCKSKLAALDRSEAIAHVEAIGDPYAAASIWTAFAADARHHAMMGGVLSRFTTQESTNMLAALAVYSGNPKATAAAIRALAEREPSEFGEKIVMMMHNPMTISERSVPIPDGFPGRELFVEADTCNYQLFFSIAQPQNSLAFAGTFQPRFSPDDLALARQGLDQQVAMARAIIEKHNTAIKDLNRRVATVLNRACGARIQPQPEDGRRWLASVLQTEYTPVPYRAKPTLSEIIPPLYVPTFVPTPCDT